MTSRSPSAPALLALALVPMLALAGCSAPSPASPGSSHAATPIARATSAAPAQVKDTPITTGAELCSLATAAEATSTLGTPKPFAELDPQDTKTTRR